MTSMFDIRSDINGYRKDSMDRLGDDLTQEVIQYLTFEDKIRLECVSKHWQRCVYRKQFIIEIGDTKSHNSLNKLLDEDKELLDEELLESVLKKCPNIEEFILYSDVYTPVNSSVLSLIGRYCHRIKSLTFYGTIVGSDENVLSFFRDNGHKLEDLYCTAFPIFSHCNDEEILKLCPKCQEKFILKICLFLSNDNKEFLPKLERIESNILISSENLNEMKILSVKYSQTIKSLDITLYELSAEELKDMH